MSGAADDTNGACRRHSRRSARCRTTLGNLPKVKPGRATADPGGGDGGDGIFLGSPGGLASQVQSGHAGGGPSAPVGTAQLPK